MRRSYCPLFGWLVRAACVAAVVAAFVAGGTGLDLDQKWGPFRQALLAIGTAGLLIPLASRLIAILDQRLIQRGSHMARSTPASEETSSLASQTEAALPLAEPEGSRAAQASPGATKYAMAKSKLPLAVVFLSVCSLYVWFVSVGQMTRWPQTTDYYSLLSEAFLAGRTELLVEPSPQLSEIRDPYSESERKGISIRNDLSFYRGRYFIYWGPVPAILALPIGMVFQRPIGDQHITFVANTVAFVFMALILGHIRRAYFPMLPRWLFVGGLIVAASAHPMLWMLSWGAVYSAAISSGQAFLMAGLYFALPILDGSSQARWRLAAAGIFWTLGIGSRLNLIGPVGILTLVTLGGLLLGHKVQIRKAYRAAVPLLVPLGVGAALLGTYNFIRFGSFLETGLRYQLTSAEPYHLIERGELFNVSYLWANLLYHLGTPIRFSSVFPFMKPVRGALPPFTMFLGRLNVPGSHSVEDITGLVAAAPFVLFAGVLAGHVMCGPSSHSEAADGGFRRLGWGLLLATAAAAAPVLLYYMVTSRFLLDYSPLLIIASVIGAWLLFVRSQRYPVRRTLVGIMIAMAITYTLVAGFLLALSGPASLFDDYNPTLWQALISLTTRQ